MKKKFILYVSLLVCFGSSVWAQDPRERTYGYEILEPKHEPKPKVFGFGFGKSRIEEKLNRGLLISIANDNKSVYLSWRLLKTDTNNVRFNVYRSQGGQSKKINSKPIADVSDFLDAKPLTGDCTYWIEILNGQNKETSEKVIFKPLSSQSNNYKTLKLKGNVIAGKVAVADLNGDGEYDYIIRHPETNTDPGMPGDSTNTTFKIEAYLSDGTYLWTKDLGYGIEPGIWYSPFVAYDFDGDGKAEVAIKTAGNDFVKNEKGRVCGGSEYLTILNGMTGEEIAKVDWPERNDRYGNIVRQNRNQMGFAFLDGKTPFILAARGTYRLMVVDAWELKDGKLKKNWRWDGDEENPVVRSQGAHNMVCGDVDGDGRDEILLGGCMLDDDGTLLWSAGLGHPDKAYMTDIDPSRDGMEVFLALEPWHDNGFGVCMLNAKTGERIWGIGQKTYHVGDGMVADIDLNSKGLECFASEDRKGGTTDKYLLSSTGQMLARNSDVPPCRNWIWWDAGKVRQTFFGDDNTWGAGSSSKGKKQSIGYWKGEKLTQNIEGDIIMIADLLGDWREEVVTALPGETENLSYKYKSKRQTHHTDAGCTL